MILEYKNIKPKIGKAVFVAPTAVVIGDVEIGDDASIWFGTVVRGDVNSIRIGKGTNIQDNSVVHVNNEHSPKPSKIFIGNDVTIGHQVILHGCSIEDECLIGMGSLLMDGVVIEKNSVIGAGSLVTMDTVIPSGYLAMGRPAKVIRKLNEQELALLLESAEHYQRLAKTYG